MLDARALKLDFIGILIVPFSFCALLYLADGTRGVSFPDEFTYINSAKNIARNGTDRIPVPKHPFEFRDVMTVKVAQDISYPKYAPGNSLILALAYKLGGMAGIFLTRPIFAFTALVLTYLIGCNLVNKFVGLFMELGLCFSPTFAVLALYLFPHLPSLTFTLLGCYLFIRCFKRESRPLGLLAGFVLGLLTAIRSTDFLLLAPLLIICIGYKRFGLAAKLIIGITLPILFLFYYNLTHFGHIFKTGYDLTLENSFHLKNILPNLIMYLKNFVLFEFGLFIPIILIGWYKLLYQKTLITLSASLYIFTVIILFCAYSFTFPQNTELMRMRFLLNLIPIFLIFESVAFDRLRMSFSKSRLVALMVIFIIAGWSYQAENIRHYITQRKDFYRFESALKNQLIDSAEILPPQARVFVPYEMGFDFKLFDAHRHLYQDDAFKKLLGLKDRIIKPCGTFSFQESYYSLNLTNDQIKQALHDLIAKNNVYAIFDEEMFSAFKSSPLSHQYKYEDIFTFKYSSILSPPSGYGIARVYHLFQLKYGDTFTFKYSSIPSPSSGNETSRVYHLFQYKYGDILIFKYLSIPQVYHLLRLTIKNADIIL